jgi:hypothetical protein
MRQTRLRFKSPTASFADKVADQDRKDLSLAKYLLDDPTRYEKPGYTYLGPWARKVIQRLGTPEEKAAVGE